MGWPGKPVAAAMAIVLGACLFAPPRPGGDDGGVGDDDGPDDGGPDDGGAPNDAAPASCSPTALAELSVTAAIPASADTDYLVRAGRDHAHAMIYLYEPDAERSPLRACSDHRVDLTPNATGDARVVAVGRMGSNRLLAMVWEENAALGGLASAVILELPGLTEVTRSAPLQWMPPADVEGAPFPFIAYGELATPPVSQVWFGASEVFVWADPMATTSPTKPTLNLGSGDKLLLATSSIRVVPLFDAVGAVGTYSAPHLQGAGTTLDFNFPRADRDAEMCTVPVDCPPQIARPIHGGPIFAAGYSSVVAPVRTGNAYIIAAESPTSVKMTVPGFTGAILDVTVADLPPRTLEQDGVDLVAIVDTTSSIRELVFVDAASSSTPVPPQRVRIAQNLSRLVVGRFGVVGETKILALALTPDATVADEECLINTGGGLRGCLLGAR